MIRLARPSRSLWLAFLLVLAPLLGWLRPTSVAAATFPAGFNDALVASVGAPTALAFTPDGRMLVTQQSGGLRVYRDTALLGTALTLGTRVCSNGERGLLGVAVDPNFNPAANNRYIYLFYTFNKHNICANNSPSSPVNRVSRFVLADNNTVSLASETVLIDNMPSPNSNHNAGDLNFGKDGFLYVTIGDGGCDYAGDSGCAGNNDAARDRHVLTGKVLRITRDGAIPPGNPFTGAGSARCNVTGSTTAGTWCQETFAWGLRNPFRFAFDPNASGTRFFINDVGQGEREEIDNGQAGADYGWNCREGTRVNSTSGKCSPAPSGMVDPIYNYDRSNGCASITGGAFVPNGVWPAAYDGAYIYGDYVCGKLFALRQTGGAWTATEFATGLGGSSAVHLRFGPYCGTQALYYTTYAGGGEVRRVVNGPAANCAPSAVISANPRSGPSPLTVTFSGAGSSDPNAGDTLTYLWDFGDGASSTTATQQTTHRYTSSGTYTASLRVRDNGGLTSPPVTVQIGVDNAPPVPMIALPPTGDLYRGGSSYTLTGSAIDPQDGPLAASRLSWTVILHHDTHTHPVVGPVTGGSVTFTAPIHEEGTTWLEVRLTATDSQGFAATTSRLLYRAIAFGDVPPGHPAHGAIAELAARGIIKGYDARGCSARGLSYPCFVPNDTSLRAQMAVLIVRAIGWGGEQHPNPFTDRGGLVAELWDAIGILAAHDVARGYGDGRFGPNDSVTEAQVVSFIARAMVERGYWQPATADNPALYPNVPASSGHRLDLVTYHRYAGALPDRPANATWGTWASPATRAWFARTLWQACGGILTGPPVP